MLSHEKDEVIAIMKSLWSGMNDSSRATHVKPCIVEEVPGAPRNEQFYIRGAGVLVDYADHQYGGFPCFESKMEAEMFLARFGILDFDVERYEP